MLGCATGGWPAGRRRRGAELAQPILELAVAVLQFLVLAGQLAELVFQPLDPHLQIGVVGLRLALRIALLLRTLPGKRDLGGCGLRGQTSIAAIAAAPAALKNLDDILP